MTGLLHAALFVAAFVFIAASAAMNALFLSSLGRTPVEIGLLAAISIAADIAKFVLPVLLARAIQLRAWGYSAAASFMLLLVILLSLASGLGFSAMTRGAVTSARDAAAHRLGQLRKDLAESNLRLAALGAAQEASVIQAELATLQTDRRYAATKACSELNGGLARQFCSELMKKREALRRAEAHATAVEERRGIVASINALEVQGAGQESDQQAHAIAALFGISRDLPRVILASSVAVTLELGSIFLVLLASGPMLRRRQETGIAPSAEPLPVAVPLQADRTHWQRKRSQKKETLGAGFGERLGEHGHS